MNKPSDDVQFKSGQMKRMLEGTEVKASSREHAIPRGSRQEDCKGRKMQKESKMVGCTLLNGSQWSTENKYMRRYKGTHDNFFGVEHRMKKEEMKEQFNKAAKQGCS